MVDVVIFTQQYLLPGALRKMDADVDVDVDVDVVIFTQDHLLPGALRRMEQVGVNLFILLTLNSTMAPFFALERTQSGGE